MVHLESGQVMNCRANDLKLMTNQQQYPTQPCRDAALEEIVGDNLRAVVGALLSLSTSVSKKRV